MLIFRHLQGFFDGRNWIPHLIISYHNFRWIWVMFWGMGWVKYTTQLGCETSLLSQGVKKGAKTTGKYELQTFLEEKYFC